MAEWRWGQERGNIREAYCRRILGEDAEVAATAAEQLYTYECAPNPPPAPLASGPQL